MEKPDIAAPKASLELPDRWTFVFPARTINYQCDSIYAPVTTAVVVLGIYATRRLKRPMRQLCRTVNRFLLKSCQSTIAAASRPAATG